VIPFAERALQILEAAECAAALGENSTGLTILIAPDGAVHMKTNPEQSGADWPLDRLMAHHGAASGYRVSSEEGLIRVEAREGNRVCRLEGTTPRRTAHALLGSSTSWVQALTVTPNLRPIP
jgi:hypothetical protein